MRILAILLAMAPAMSQAGGYATVEAPCYPDTTFDLCAVPVPDGHRDGYLPGAPDMQAQLFVGTVRDWPFPPRDRFAILVTPNLGSYDVAVRKAAGIAAAHCGQQGGETVVARIDERQRYAPEDLESWKFSGSCQ